MDPLPSTLFQNTLEALHTCDDHLYDKLPPAEAQARNLIIRECVKIAHEMQVVTADPVPA